MLLGLDLSHWRTVRSFEQMRAAGVHFVYTKATEGARWVDATFPRYWQGLHSAGIHRGAFHYYLPAVDPEQQARFFFETVAGHTGQDAAMLPACVDFEEDGADPRRFKMFLDACESFFKHKPLIYTSVRFWLNPPPTWIGSYSLWVASWYRSVPTLPRGWPRWLFWQQTNRGDGRAFGLVESTVDVNYFAGDEQELDALVAAGGTTASPTAPSAIRVRAGLNLRAAPWGAEIGAAFAGSTWAVTGLQYDSQGRPWFYVNPRGCLAGWLCDVI